VLRLQVQSARERLRALARLQAEEYQAGWRVQWVEKEFQGVLDLAGMPVWLRIDRIDRHVDGRVRVIDYKTHRKESTPRSTHLKRFSPEESPSPLGPLLAHGKTAKSMCRWTDLQLPLYALTVQKSLGLATPPQAFYALLPEAVSAVQFVEFDNLRDCLDNALLWAEEAARRIRQGVFWPPAKEVPFDLLGGMAPEGLEQALGPSWTALLSGSSVAETKAPS
jgi:ATP-dependent helicase/nuclease subunit B